MRKRDRGREKEIERENELIILANLSIWSRILLSGCDRKKIARISLHVILENEKILHSAHKCLADKCP